MSRDDAQLLADSLVESELAWHSLSWRVASPGLCGRSSLSRVWIRGVGQRWPAGKGAVTVVDGNNSMGQIGATFAMKQAIELAHVHGIGAAALRGSNHMRCHGPLRGHGGQRRHDRHRHDPMRLPTMAPWGGADKIVGINPIAVALPGGEEEPIVLDMAMGAHCARQNPRLRSIRSPAAGGLGFRCRRTSDHGPRCSASRTYSPQ
jgi:LDH2 family malate/lactate/ureidoglycolate dehydrogenase